VCLVEVITTTLCRCTKLRYRWQGIIEIIKSAYQHLMTDNSCKYVCNPKLTEYNKVKHHHKESYYNSRTPIPMFYLHLHRHRCIPNLPFSKVFLILFSLLFSVHFILLLLFYSQVFFLQPFTKITTVIMFTKLSRCLLFQHALTNGCNMQVPVHITTKWLHNTACLPK